MGGCLSRTRLQKYSDHFEKLHLGQLNDLWSTIKTYKIKQLFGKHARSEDNCLDLSGFRALLPGLQIYSDNVVRRIFQIFDRDERLAISFSNFLRGLSICNYGPDEIMLAIIFMIYDEGLERKLNSVQLAHLYTNHKRFLLEPELMEQDDFIKEMLGSKEEVEVEEFMGKCMKKNIYNLDEYKRIYSVFPEERIEKELAVNFTEWNKLYSQNDEKYVSYVLSYKWFQAWKIYAQGQYKIFINLDLQNQPLKRKTVFRSKTKLNTLKAITVSVKKQKTEDTGHCKTLNFVHGDIGEKPREIDNSVLEGEYEGILNSNLSDCDYLLVSEKVWNYFHTIYEGGPVFRRTGVEKIEMEPKLVKIYSSLFKDKLDYSSQIIRQVPCSISTFQILTQSIQIPQDTLPNYCVYSKVIDGKWQRTPDLHLTLQQLHNQVLIFLVYLPIQLQLTFISNHVNIQHNHNSFNIGDVMTVSLGGEPKQKIVYLGVNNQGRHILHLTGQTYKTDLCVDDEELKRLIGENQGERERPKGGVVVAQNMPHGVRSSGNSFLAAILPIFNSIPEFLSVLMKGTKDIQPAEKSVAKEMANIFEKLTRAKSVSSRGLSNAIYAKLPKLHNSYEHYVREMVGMLEKELESTKHSDSIRDIAGIRYKTIKQCQSCRSKSEESQNVLGMEVKVPLGEQLTYRVTYVPYSQAMNTKEIKKFAFKLKRGSKLSDYKKKLEEVIGITDNYMIAQVYQNNIVKNFSTAEESQTLDKLHLRQADDIYVYDLFVDFESFVKEHYRTNKQMDLDDIKINHFIDCLNQDQGWIFGKVCSIQYLTYTKRTIVSVIHKINRFEQWKIGYDLFQIALFPTKSSQNCQQFLLRVNQRRFNQSTNNMQHIGMPLVVTLPQWMRWKQFFFLMYLQMKRFIIDDEDHGEMQAEDVKMLKSTKTVKVDPETGGHGAKKKTTVKLQQKKKLNKFKEYLSSEEFPYKLNLVDMEGRCAVCFRFVKDTLFKGEGDAFCTGCKVSESDPISWQIKCTEVMVCVDWKKIAKVKKDEEIIKNHPSLLNTLEQSKAEAVTLTECLQKHFKPSTIDVDDSTCCNRQSTLNLTRSIQKIPQFLFITLDRTLQIQGFKKRMQKVVKYDTSLTGIGKKGNYDLYAVVYLQGPNKYKSLLQAQKGNWVEYDGQHVIAANKKDVLGRNADILIYRTT